MRAAVPTELLVNAVSSAGQIIRALPAMTAPSVAAKKAAPDTDEIMNSIVPKAILFRQCLMMSIWMHDKKQEDPMFVHMHTSQLRETNSTDSHAKSK